MTHMDLLIRQRDVAKDLQSVVRVMKSLSAVSIRQFEVSAESMDQYHHTVSLGLQALVRDRMIGPGAMVMEDGRTLSVIVGSDRGLCGRFNEAVVSHYQSSSVAGQDKDRILVLGQRAAARLVASGNQLDQQIQIPAAVGGIVATVEQILLWIDQKLASENVCAVNLYANQRTVHAFAEPAVIGLLPLDWNWLSRLKNEPWPSRGRAIYHAPGAMLMSTLIREHLFVTLFRCLAESLASEHASRLAAMQRAESYIEDYLEELSSQVDQQRQGMITQELLDIVSSYKMLKQRRVAVNDTRV